MYRRPVIRQTATSVVIVLALLAGCSSRTSRFKQLSPISRARSVKSPIRFSDKQALEVQLALARTLHKQRNLEAAATVYHRIIDRSPKQVEAVHRLAILYDQQGRFAESEKLFRKALKLRPGNSNVFCDLGYSFYLQRRWSEAEMNFRQAIELDKEHARAHNHLGLLLSQLDRREEALAQFRKAGCTLAEAHTNAALILTLDGRMIDAQEEFQYAFAAGPKSVVPRLRTEETDARDAEIGYAQIMDAGNAEMETHDRPLAAANPFELATMSEEQDLDEPLFAPLFRVESAVWTNSAEIQLPGKADARVRPWMSLGALKPATDGRVKTDR
jgi:Flp pilus assembly protein TadD